MELRFTWSGVHDDCLLNPYGMIQNYPYLYGFHFYQHQQNRIRPPINPIALFPQGMS